MVCQNAKRCFLGHCWGFGGFVFFVSLCFCAFALYTIAQNGYFPAFLEVFCLFCSHKRPVFNCFFSSYFVFCCFCLPFQKSIFSLLFVHQPLFRKDSLWGFFCFSFACLFLFLMFACLFEIKFPNIPFLKPKLLSFLEVYFFSSAVLVYVFMVYVSAFLFLCWLCFGYSLVFVLCFCFCLVSCFAFSLWKKLFFLQFWCLFELCWLNG